MLKTGRVLARFGHFKHDTCLIFIINFITQAKGDNQQSHIRKRDTVNGKSEKKEEKEKPKDHDMNERKEKEIKKETEEKLDVGKYYFLL